MYLDSKSLFLSKFTKNVLKITWMCELWDQRVSFCVSRFSLSYILDDLKKCLLFESKND